MSLPPANWYDDPIDPAFERWWDGAAWTEHRRPKASLSGGGVAPPAGELRDVGDMISHAFSLIRARIAGIIGVSLIAAAAIAVAYGVLIVSIFGLAAVDFYNDGFSDIDGGAIALMVLIFVVAGALAVVSFLTTATMLWDAAVGEQRAWAAAFGNGFRRLFPYLGWLVLGSLPMYGVILLAVAISTGSDSGAGGLIFLLAFVPLMYWALVLYFVPVVVVRNTGENALMASFELVRGRWWRVFGRMLAWGLIMIGIGLGLGILFSLVTAGVAGSGDTGPLGAFFAIVFAGVGLTGFFMYYSLQVAPVVSITYDLIASGRPTGDPTAVV